jgi:hypothetical protein
MKFNLSWDLGWADYCLRGHAHFIFAEKEFFSLTATYDLWCRNKWILTWANANNTCILFGDRWCLFLVCKGFNKISLVWYNRLVTALQHTRIHRVPQHLNPRFPQCSQCTFLNFYIILCQCLFSHSQWDYLIVSQWLSLHFYPLYYILYECIWRSFGDKVNLSDILMLIEYLMMSLFIIQSTVSKIVGSLFDCREPKWVAWGAGGLEGGGNLVVVLDAWGASWMGDQSCGSFILMEAEGT